MIRRNWRARSRTLDIRLEADIHAIKGNSNGFGQGDWIPYLGVDYVLVKLDGDQTAKGRLTPVAADDGPVYGENVRMFGPGKYKLSLTITAPDQAKPVEFGRQVDKKSGVGPWFKPFTVDYEFTYAGFGKNGSD